jgi:hypothetical protein
MSSAPARRGHLVGSLPWGYTRDTASKVAVPDPERAPLVGEMFERYATGQESDRRIAAWLNAKGGRTARGHAFGKDTVREFALRKEVLRGERRRANPRSTPHRFREGDQPIRHHARGDKASPCAATVLSAGRRPRIHDTWIAATALVNDAEVWTQDSDFSDFERAVTVVRV